MPIRQWNCSLKKVSIATCQNPGWQIPTRLHLHIQGIGVAHLSGGQKQSLVLEALLDWQ